MPLPGTPFRNYPSVCSNVVWQKHKSFKDKVKAKTKTGLGDTLKAAEKAWAKINWEVIDIKKKKGAASLKIAQDNLTKAKAMVLNVEATKAAVTTAYDKAMLTKGNTDLSADAKRQAEVIANGMKNSLGNLNKVANIEDEFEAEVKRLGG